MAFDWHLGTIKRNDRRHAGSYRYVLIRTSMAPAEQLLPRECQQEDEATCLVTFVAHTSHYPLAAYRQCAEMLSRFPSETWLYIYGMGKQSISGLAAWVGDKGGAAILVGRPGSEMRVVPASNPTPWKAIDEILGPYSIPYYTVDPELGVGVKMIGSKMTDALTFEKVLECLGCIPLLENKYLCGDTVF